MYFNRKKKKILSKMEHPVLNTKWELLQGIQTQGSIKSMMTEKTRQFSIPGRLYILLENKNIQLGMDYLRHDQRSFKKRKKEKEKRKVKVVSKTLKSMVRLVVFWYIEQQIQKEFVRVPRRYTRVIFLQ